MSQGVPCLGGKPFPSVEEDRDFPGVLEVLGSSHVTLEGDLLKDKGIVLLALWKSVRVS